MTENIITEDYKMLMQKQKCCVIIPTFNNCRTLASVIHGVLKFSNDIIVVNDGSTDDTGLILSGFDKITVINFEKNTGKGYALKRGFRKAIEKGFDYAITIDSDGQHDPNDIPAFIDKIIEEPGSLIIGNRNMNRDGIPKKSSFGNRFSNFWFWIETGKRMPDTQSGFRLYPVSRYKKTGFMTRKFEFEIEVIVKSAWKGIKVIPVPVSVKYFNEEEKVSHFRPFTDFARISILNSFLVLLAILFFRPFGFIMSLNRKTISEFFNNHFVNNKDSDSKIIFSVMLGAFMGVAPVWGWQMAIALLLAIVLKLNKVITLVVSNISVPPMIPIILYLSYKFGGLVYYNPIEIVYDKGLNIGIIGDNLIQYLLGSLLFGVALSLFSGITTYFLLKVLRKRKNNNIDTLK
jgi:glycosyltransferase involved in cell wall biosynthesis